MLLPVDLLTRLTATQQAAVLAHELAHLRRRDHWMRWLDTPILGLFWWHPVAWWARRRLQHAEEQCCDAWVLWILPGKAKEYARTLLVVVDFLAEIRPAISPVACGFRQTSPLLRRFEMILREGTARRVSWRTRVALLAVAAVLLPLSPLALGSKGDASPEPNRDREGAAKYAAGPHEAAWASPPAAPDVAAPAASAPGGRSAAECSSPSYVPKSSASSKDSGNSQKASPVILEQRQKVWEAKQRLLEAQAALEYHQRELAHAETETVQQSNKDSHAERTQKGAAMPTASAERVVPREPVAQPAQPSSSARESRAATRRELLEAKRRLATEKERRLEAEHRLANHQREVENAEAEVARLEGPNISEALQQRLKEVEAQDKRTRERYESWIAAKHAVDAVQKAHEEGSVTLNVLLETQRRAAEAEIQYWDMLSEASGRNDTATRRLNTLITARNRALQTWRQMQQWKKRGLASADDEAKAREQYLLFQNVVTKAADAIQEEIDPKKDERPVAPRR